MKPPARSSSASPTRKARKPGLICVPFFRAHSTWQRARLAAIEKLTNEFWPGIPVVPTMSTGATDGSYLRNSGIPTYGHSGLAGEIDDVRAHGRDERVLVKSFFDGHEY